MLSDILSRTDFVVFPLVTVVLFSAVFVAAIAWVYRPGSRSAYERRGMLALEDGTGSTPTHKAVEG